MHQQYQTDDTILATALFLCGVPAWIDEKGNPQPQIMIYTRDRMRELGYSGKTFLESCRDAFKNRKSGTRIYQFQRSETLERIVKEYRRLQMADAAAKAEGKGDAGGIHLERPEAEDVAAIVYFAQRFRQTMLSDFKTTALMVSTEGIVQKREDSESAKWAERETGQFIGTITGKFSAVSIHAAPETIKAVRI